MKVLRVLLATVLAVCGLALFAPAPPASACSCVIATPADYVDWADAVFVGTLTSPPLDEGEGPTVSSGDPLVYTFDVETVFEGSVGATAEVQSARFGASCGLEGMQVGDRYLMFAEAGRRQDILSASLCGGSRPVSNNLIRRVDTLTAAGLTPARIPAVTPRAADAVSDLESGTPTVGHVLIGFSTVVLVAVVWVLLPPRRRKVGGPA